MDPKNFTPMAHRRVGVVMMQDSDLMKVLEGYYAVRLDENEDDFSQKLTWCLEHCQSKFRDIRESKQRVWYFQNQHDATLFAMRWA